MFVMSVCLSCGAIAKTAYNGCRFGKETFQYQCSYFSSLHQSSLIRILNIPTELWRTWISSCMFIAMILIALESYQGITYRATREK